MALRRALRVSQKVLPTVAHWMPEAMAKRTGVLERSWPEMLPMMRPNVPGLVSDLCSQS